MCVFLSFFFFFYFFLDEDFLLKVQGPVGSLSRRKKEEEEGKGRRHPTYTYFLFRVERKIYLYITYH